MYHTAAQDLDPTGALTEPAALTAALKAGDIYLRTGLCEREMMGTEFYFGLFGPNSSFANSASVPFKSANVIFLSITRPSI